MISENEQFEAGAQYAGAQLAYEFTVTILVDGVPHPEL
jgi:hypothetical protein